MEKYLVSGQYTGKSALEAGASSKKRKADDGGDDDRRPPDKKASGKKTKAGDKPKPESVNAGWLNGLALGEAQRLHNLLVTRSGSHTVYGLPDADVQELVSCTNVVDFNRNGQFYRSFITCSVVALTHSDSANHPRYQIDVGATGVNSLANAVKAVMSNGSWQAFKALANNESSRQQIKILCHHVAYNASPIRVSAPIPQDVGSGGSISHLCDRQGCVERSHLEATPAHVDNMARQRCEGVTLVLYAGAIIMESPCSHGMGKGSRQAEIDASCRKIRLVRLGEEQLALMQQVNLLGSFTGLD